MRIFNRSTLFPTFACLAAAVVSCHREEGPNPEPETSHRIEVAISAPATRTALQEDGLTARWTKGDRIALWAYGAETAAFENVPFTLWYPREAPEQGLFTGMIGAMNAGTYDYYASYPVPEAAEGTEVTYTIPTLQDGTWNGDLDIMLAAAQSTELKEEILNELTLHFRHKVHALKITIPEGRNLLGRPIERLRIRFPQPVAGRMTWNLKNPDAAPRTEATADAVTLDFAHPVDAGDTFWVFIAPADLTGGEVTFTATDGTEYSWPLSAWNFRDCTAGAITPVKLTIDEARPQRDFRLTVDPAHLGEAVTQVDRLEMPEGYEFPSLELDRTTRAITANTDGTFSLKIFADQAGMLCDGMEVGMGVGSENTEGVYSKKCAMSHLSADGCTVEAPYLFYEDFSGIASFDAGANNGMGNPTAEDLTPYNLPGWYGARAQGEAGKSVRIRINSNGLVYYPARMDSCPIGGIKAGHSVKIKVTFNADAYNQSPDKMRCKVGTSNGGGGFAGNDSNNTAETLTIAENPSSGFDNIAGEYACTISDCTAETCLSWNYTKNSGWVSGYTSMFMDNIRVTIVQ